MKRINILLITLAAVGFAACSGDDDDNKIITPEEPAQTLRPLTIEVSETPMVNPEAPSNSPKRGENAPATRAAVTTLSTLSAFNLEYMYGALPYYNDKSITANKDGEGKWTTTGSWPDTDTNNEVNWYAHSHGTFFLTDDANKYPYISFTVEETATKQKDLLVATASGTWDETKGNLSFTFDHACTALRFYVKKATNLSDYTLSITNVTLCNVIKHGEYYYGTQSWMPGSSRSNYTLYSGSAKTLGTTDYEALDASAAPYLFLIPQTLTPWDGTTAIASATTQTYLQISCSISGATSFSGTAYIPFAGTFEQGKQHDVKINIGKNSLYSSANTKIIN